MKILISRLAQSRSQSHFLLQTTVRTVWWIPNQSDSVSLKHSLTRNVETLATSGPSSSAMISRVMHCVLASMPLLTKMRRGSLLKFNTGFNAAKFDLDSDALSVVPGV